MLSRELKELEVNELMVREVSPMQSTSGHLPPFGIAYKLGALTECMAAWGLQHRERILRAGKAKL